MRKMMIVGFGSLVAWFGVACAGGETATPPATTDPTATPAPGAPAAPATDAPGEEGKAGKEGKGGKGGKAH
jgi:hypothetical protein